MFALMPGMVIGQGVQPIIGFNYGAQNFERAIRSIKLALLYSTIWSTIAFFTLYFSPEPIIRLFSSDAELIKLSAHAAKIAFSVMPLIGFMMVGSTIFQAIGKVLPSIITSLARSAMFLLPSVLILPRFLQIEGVWLAFPVTDILTTLLTASLLIPQLLELRKKHKSHLCSGFAESIV
jgi:Na+-driven multidrug efflux pump